MKRIEAKGPIISNTDAWLYKWLGWQCTSPQGIAGMLEEAAGDEVILEINSTGGSVMAGYEIYKNLMDYSGKITAHVIVACSAATFLACAADETKISDGGIYMIHNVQSWAEGDYRDMQMEADALRQFNEGVINIYERKTKKTREELQQLMDQDTYMAPAMAIEYGFVDGFIYERQEHAEKQPENVADFVHSIAASSVPVISPEKLNKLAAALKELDAGVAPVQQRQNTGNGAGSDNKEQEGGNNKMTLKEFLAENVEGKAEVDALVAEALAKGTEQERERMKSLDAISATVPADMLNEAKYGENPMDGKTLAYQAMVNGEKAAEAYMKNAMDDSKASGVEEVGVGAPDAGQEQADESDEMASYVNKMKGEK